VIVLKQNHSKVVKSIIENTSNLLNSFNPDFAVGIVMKGKKAIKTGV
jgi:hypothetical protein